MDSAGMPIAIRTSPEPRYRFDPRAIPPTLVKRDAPATRTKIWEFSTNLHCSIIGTCLSATELRAILRKLGLAAPDHTDHELHGIGVTLAARRDDAARQLHKALDHRHKLAISQAAKAGTEDALRTLWRDAVRRGDIPSAYWATLTHPACTQALVREAFGEVHMLSHLVGSANRADLRRLCQLEAEKSELQEKLNRQQQAFHAAIVLRDQRIEALQRALADRSPTRAPGPNQDQDALSGLVADLQRKLDTAFRRTASLQDRLVRAQTLATRDQTALLAAEQKATALQRERDALEAELAPGPALAPEGTRLDGKTLLYVGGRPNQIAPMRDAASRLGATLLHHDGGIEHHPNLLPGLVSRCDIALFPVDCISHDAANAVKSLCRQGGKRFLPLRSASVSSLLAVLREPFSPFMSDREDYGMSAN